MIKNILSIDVEETYYSEYTRQYRGLDLPYRTPCNIPSILKMLKNQDIKATFFVVGEIAERFPEIVEMILEEGHEVAFHGYTHLPLWRITPETFEEEIRLFKGMYPNCKGYRAPNFSLNNKTKWALKILQDNGYQYDSSIFPTWTPLYGICSAPAKPYKPCLSDLSKEDVGGSIIEFPLMVSRILRLKIPIAGGFWLRFFSANLIRKSIEKANGDNNPAVVYVHNWELQPDGQKLSLPVLSRFLTYHNIEHVKEKILSLTKCFPFTSFSEYLKDQS